MSLNQFEVKIHKMGTGFFQCKFRDPKTGSRIRKRFDSLKEAKNFKKTTESQVNSKGENVFSDLRISQAMKDFLENSPGSNVRGRKNHFKSFIDTFGVYKVTELTQTDLRKWILNTKDQLDLSEKTLNSICSQFFGFFQYLMEENYLTVNPVKGIRFNRHANSRRPRIVFSVGEVREILANAKTFSPNVLIPNFLVSHIRALEERRS
ncbi:MAG: hypothetical protein PHY93_20450 [Bacteriovorax sp.]|nr:hypothetical protein [Bacteriovorax sp.]